MTNYFALLFVYVLAQTLPCTSAKNRLLLISLDGFRYDYMQHYKPANLSKFVASGVTAPSGMFAVFPTKTFPNHYTLVTGLYPESHGVVDNYFYDPNYNETFNMTFNTESKWFDEAEPIWITAKAHGLKTGAFSWPGSTVVIHNKTADEFTGFNMSIAFNDRVDAVIDWFANRDVTFAALYFEEPDGAGHQCGTMSLCVENMVATLDATIGYLMMRLEANRLLDTTDVIIISDHGMTNTSRDPNKNLMLENYLTWNDILTIPQAGPVTAIWPSQGKTDVVFSKLNNVHPNFTVYHKKDIPERFHYRDNRRIPPIIIIADESYQSAQNATTFLNTSIGQHGYDNLLPSMKPIFLASGPSFKQNVTIDSFDNIHIYSLMCHILGIEPQPNNGTLDATKAALRNAKPDASSSDVSVPINRGVLSAIFLLTYYLK